jgi:hypothetical protein
MNPERMRKKKFAIACATAHLFFWFWAVDGISKQAAPGSPVVTATMIMLMIAAWIQYRTVLALRRLQKEKASGVRN